MSKINIIKSENIKTEDFKKKFFGDGEWVTELDHIEFEYRGQKAKIYRVAAKEPYAVKEHYFGGYLCGYVQVPLQHEWATQGWPDIDCHGGITYSKHSNDKQEYWIGFDCAHSDDYIPSIEKFRKTCPELKELTKEMEKAFKDRPLFRRVYRNMQYCIDECTKIIDAMLDGVKDDQNEDGVDTTTIEEPLC